MRFFTTIEKAGRLEFFLVRVFITLAVVVLLLGVLEFGVNDTTLVDDPSFSETISYNQAMIPLFIVGWAVTFYLSVINACRRLKDIGKGFGMVLLLFIPIIGQLFELYLLLAKGDNDKTYAPYGDNPYDPQSWVPPSAPNSGPAVSYRGEDLYLPGETVTGPEQSPGEQAA